MDKAHCRSISSQRITRCGTKVKRSQADPTRQKNREQVSSLDSLYLQRRLINTKVSDMQNFSRPWQDLDVRSNQTLVDISTIFASEMQLFANCMIPKRLEKTAKHCDWLICRITCELTDKKDLLALFPQLRTTPAKSACRAYSQPSFITNNLLSSPFLALFQIPSQGLGLSLHIRLAGATTQPKVVW